MRSEVQELLDKEWPDTTRPSGNIRYGAFNLFSTLARTARYAMDIGDDELYEDAHEEAKKVIDPTPGKTQPSYCYSFFGIRNAEHDAIHANNPRVFVFKEKHGEYIYDASTAERASTAVLYVLEQRLEEGWLSDELSGDEEVSDQLDLLKSNNVPETEAAKARRVLEMARSGKPGCLNISGKMAYSMLMDRSGYEYEEFTIETMNVAEFDLKKEPPF